MTLLTACSHNTTLISFDLIQFYLIQFIKFVEPLSLSLCYETSLGKGLLHPEL